MRFARFNAQGRMRIGRGLREKRNFFGKARRRARRCAFIGHPVDRHHQPSCSPIGKA
jgi:hypothetical protein